MSRSEDFHRDGAFTRFLEWRRLDSSGRRQPWQLLLLGDFLDFTRVELGAPGANRRRLDVGVEVALAKLERIAAGHREVFAALRSLIGDGVALHVMPGNHDLELLHPAVQERPRQLLTPPTSGPPGAAISFHPWIYHVPGLLYAEHGQQHHDLNNIARLACWPHHPLPELPLGSSLPEYLYALMDAADPRQDPLEPSLARLAAAARIRPLAVLTALSAHAGLLRALGRHVGERSGPRAHRNRATYRRETLAAHAPSVGLEPESLAAIDRLAPRAPTRTALRLVRQRLARAQAEGTAGADVRAALRSAAAAVHDLLTAGGRAVHSWRSTATRRAAPRAAGRMGRRSGPPPAARKCARPCKFPSLRRYFENCSILLSLPWSGEGRRSTGR